MSANLEILNKSLDKIEDHLVATRTTQQEHADRLLALEQRGSIMPGEGATRHAPTLGDQVAEGAELLKLVAAEKA